jgi:hypothetical protein
MIHKGTLHNCNDVPLAMLENLMYNEVVYICGVNHKKNPSFIQRNKLMCELCARCLLGSEGVCSGGENTAV